MKDSVFALFNSKAVFYVTVIAIATCHIDHMHKKILFAFIVWFQAILDAGRLTSCAVAGCRLRAYCSTALRTQLPTSPTTHRITISSRMQCLVIFLTIKLAHNHYDVIMAAQSCPGAMRQLHALHRC